MNHVLSILATAATIGGFAFAQGASPSQVGSDPSQRGQDARGSQSEQLGRIGTTQSARSHHIVPADKILGAELKDRAGEKLSDVRDLLIEHQHGEIRYALIEIDDTRRVIPWQHVEVSMKSDARRERSDDDDDEDERDRDALELRTSLSEQQLRRAPELGDESHLGADLERRVEAIFGRTGGSGSEGRTGQRPGVGEGPGQVGQTGQSGQTGQAGAMGDIRFLRLSDLDDRAVHAAGRDVGAATGGAQPRGQKIGTIEKIVLAPQNNVVAFAVIEYQAMPGAGIADARKIAVPWQELEFERSREGSLDVSMQTSERKLSSAPAFFEEDWNRVSSTAYLQQVYSHFDAEPFWRSARFATSPRAGGADAEKQRGKDREHRDSQRRDQ